MREELKTYSSACPPLLRRGGWPKARRGGQGLLKASACVTTPAFGPPSSRGGDTLAEKLRRAMPLIALMLCFAAPTFAEYRTVELEKLRITVDTDWAYQGTPGYFPIRLDITNRGDDREIRIIGSDQRYFDIYRRGRAPTVFGAPTQVASSSFSQTLRL